MYSQNKTTLKAKEREKKKHTKRPDEKTLTFLNKVGLNGILFSTDTKTIQKIKPLRLLSFAIVILANFIG